MPGHYAPFRPGATARPAPKTRRGPECAGPPCLLVGPPGYLPTAFLNPSAEARMMASSTQKVSRK